MSRKRTVIIVVVVGALILAFVTIAIIAAIVLSGLPAAPGADKVALIRVEGVITAAQTPGGLFGDGGAGSESIVEQMEDFRKDRSVKSMVLRINSPGGSAAGSQEIYQEIERLRRAGKKVTVSMGDVAASGGYYIASAADKIYADPATLTGSIGVIMETADLHKLLSNLGISLGAVKSGKHKDMGSFSRPMTPEERDIIQSMINDVYDQFITDVSKGRKLPKEQVRKLADGRVYTGRQARDLKLVDTLGSLDDALHAAARDAGISGEFTVVEYEKGGLLTTLFGNTEAGYQGKLLGSELLHDLALRLLRTGGDVKL